MIDRPRNSWNNTGLRLACVAVLALVLQPAPSPAQLSEMPPEPSKEEMAAAKEESQSPKEEPDASEEESEDSKSGYSDTVDAGGGGSKSVSAELIDGDQIFDSMLNFDLLNTLRTDYYRFKKSLNEQTGIAYSVDYSVLATRASFSSTDDEDAASSVFRIYGAWHVLGDNFNSGGSLIFKYEHRGAINGTQSPRDLGFNTGSALSTANYKDSGWGWTDMYVKGFLFGGRIGLLVGHMDPGDWADQHVLLNAWTNLLNDSFYNNPTEAIPKRTFSAVARFSLGENWYVGGGVHDSNGKDNHIDFGQVWDTPELFTWAEFGFKRANAAFGESTHLHYWHQDKRVEAGVMESWGLAFSSSYVSDHDIKTILRIGYSEGDAAQMRRFVGVAMSLPARGSDRILFGAGWGSPPDKSLRDQTTLEVLYRAHLTQHIVISPDLQVTFKPSFNSQKNTVYMYGLRFRLTF